MTHLYSAGTGYVHAGEGPMVKTQPTKDGTATVRNPCGFGTPAGFLTNHNVALGSSLQGSASETTWVPKKVPLPGTQKCHFFPVIVPGPLSV